MRFLVALGLVFVGCRLDAGEAGFSVKNGDRVVFLGYGMNESFDGPQGLAGFIEGYEQLLAKLAPLKARLVVLSPTYHEDLGRPLPDPADQNKNLEQYTAALKKLAAGR